MAADSGHIACFLTIEKYLPDDPGARWVLASGYCPPLPLTFGKILVPSLFKTDVLVPDQLMILSAKKLFAFSSSAWVSRKSPPMSPWYR